MTISYTVDQIRADAEKLRAFHLRMHEAVTLRSRSTGDRIKWESACAEFHEQWNKAFFPGGALGWSAFMANQAEGIANALLFLEVDQVTYRSGYQKQIIWDRPKKLHLAPEEKNRLEVS